MAYLSGYLLANERTGHVVARPGRLNEFDVPRLAGRVAPPDGPMHMFLPAGNSAFGDMAFTMRRVSAKRMRADAASVSGRARTPAELNSRLEYMGYPGAGVWDFRIRTADRMGLDTSPFKGERRKPRRKTRAKQERRKARDEGGKGKGRRKSPVWF